MSKQKKVWLCFLILALLFVTACNSEQRTEPQTAGNNNIQRSNLDLTQTSQAENKTAEYPDEDENPLFYPKRPVKQGAQQFIFMDKLLMGSFADGQWFSLCSNEAHDINSSDFYLKDILAQEKYYLYQDERFVGESDRIIWDVTDDNSGIGSFEEDGVVEKLANYSEADSPAKYQSGDERVFYLPVELGEESSDLRIPSYSFYTGFSRDCVFATNLPIQPFPREISVGVKPTSEATEALVDLFKANQMGNTVPHFSECVKSDFDNDGNQEFLMIANSPRGVGGYPLLRGCDGGMNNLGTFSAVLYQDDDGSVQAVYTDLRPWDGKFKTENGELWDADYCMIVYLLGVADLNSDGVYEVGIDEAMWEWGSKVIFALNANRKYEAVLCSNDGT